MVSNGKEAEGRRSKVESRKSKVEHSKREIHMKNVFVTGANGMLGTNLIAMLIEHGYYVTGLVRDPTRYVGRKDKKLRLIKGGLFDDLTKVLSGVDCVVHIAATTDQGLPDFNDYWKVNVNASMQLYYASKRCQIKKFIYVSTANTLAHGSMESLGTEDEPYKAPFRNSLYAQSKKMAEDFLLSQSGLMEVVVVNPTFMLGAYGNRTGSARILFMSWKKKVIFYPSGGKNFVHVKDVAEGIIKCIEKNCKKERYLLANENLSYKEFFMKVNKLARQKALLVPLPDIGLVFFGVMGEMLRFLKINTQLGYVNMKILRTQNYYSNQKSIAELGMHYTSVDTAIEDAIDYCKTNLNPLIF